jgi:uncharacterized protein (DUF2461 family)
MATSFGGYPKETLQFLKTLKRNNDREWFQKNKARYEGGNAMDEIPVQLSGTAILILPAASDEPRMDTKKHESP